MTLSEAKLVATSLLGHSCLFLESPTTALGSSCCTCSKCPYPIEQASGLTPDTLQAQPSPDLPSEDGQLCCITPLLPPLPSFQYFHVLELSCGQVVDKYVHIFGGLTPGAKNPSPEGGKRG